MSGNTQVPAETIVAGSTPSPEDEQRDSSHQPITVVGLGASAGGIEALERFFQKVPPDSGLAFVIVQHLDPDHDSLLAEILQRNTALPIHKVHDRMRVEADNIYVIPPNRYLTITQGVLHLSTPEQPRGRRMPIDHFFISLAQDCYETAIAVVLSGTGTDGTLGAQAIHAQDGMVLVQAPGTAKYDGMPQSVINAGCASHILPVDAMPAVLLSKRPLKHTDTENPGLDRILQILRRNAGYDFSQYKKHTILRRIERRMQLHNINDQRAYARFIQENPLETRALFKELLINVTGFFRDPEAFVVLETEVLPMLLTDKPDSHTVRVWVAGCASGEEAYSIAILLREYMDRTHAHLNVQLYATDLDDEAIAFARNAVYPARIADEVSAERLNRFFVKDENGYKVAQPIREMVIFATQNIIKDPPFLRLDLLCCRNLLIYLESPVQNQLIQMFHYALQPDGILFMSPSEGIGNHNEAFTLIDRKWKFYRVTPGSKSSPRLSAANRHWHSADTHPLPDEAMKTLETINFTELTKHMLLQTFAPASVVTDGQGNILFVHGDTGKYLRPAPGKPSLNVIDMAREGLQEALRTGIDSCVNEGIDVLNREISVAVQPDNRMSRLSVRMLPGPDAGQKLLLISFEEMAQSAPRNDTAAGLAGTAADDRVKELERHLMYTKASLLTTIDEQQAANEETKSINEELQATNEELETSREELQSINEELVTVNTELQLKIEQLSSLQNDIKNLLDNIDVGTIFLDENLLIRRFSREATQLYHMAQSDLGRALGDIKSRLAGGDLIQEARNVLDTLKAYQAKVRTTEGRNYLARIQPYRTLANTISGVVLTFTDITEYVNLEQAIQSARTLSEAIVDTIREPLLVLTPQLSVVAASRAFYQFFQLQPADTMGRPIYEIGSGQWNLPLLREILEKILPDRQTLENFEIKLDFPEIGHQSLRLSAIASCTSSRRWAI